METTKNMKAIETMEIIETKLDLRAFNQNSQIGLLFSIFDNLKSGGQVKVVCDTDPDSLKKEFQNADLETALWRVDKLNDELWEVAISKPKQDSHKNGECCGVCGGAGQR
ncbi:MAG: DUF2249 domain-containing protein [Bdellovibrionaceae bacterium]|nr:DUF2249 domain-containing protein [Pseudobdellovibrionaceae bacterium]